MVVPTFPLDGGKYQLVLTETTRASVFACHDQNLTVIG